jgi:hypothetical protein
MTVNTLPSERAAVVGVINPDAYAANTYTSGYIALKDHSRFMAIILAGALVSNATLDAKLIAYTNASGGGATDIPGSAITQMTQAGTDDNKQAVINLNTDSLAGSAFTHFRLSVILGTAGADMGAVVLGFDPRHKPAASATTVDEVVSA